MIEEASQSPPPNVRAAALRSPASIRQPAIAAAWICPSRSRARRGDCGRIVPAPIVLRHLAPAKVSEVYESYWRFAAERQAVFFRRARGETRPWTDNPVLAIYKFTNAYRASDRVSQYLIRHVIYRDDLPKSPREVFFRILLFKLFNKIETWELLERSLGPITFEDYRFAAYDAVLARAMRDGRRIYSAAYIMPPGSSAFGRSAKHQNHLLLLERMMEDRLPERLAQTRTMQEGFEKLRAYPTIGDFLAYQFITDINYSEITDFSEMDFVVPGPGARDGLRKCFVDPGGLNEPELIRLMADLAGAGVRAPGPRLPITLGAAAPTDRLPELVLRSRQICARRSPANRGADRPDRIKQKFEPISDSDRVLLSAEMEAKREDTRQRRRAASRAARAAAG